MPIEIFHLPDAGEGLTEAEIVRWLVEPGDSVSVNQMVVEIETAKATVELPIPWAGVVSEIHEEIGAVVPVGARVISIETQVESQRDPVLVGYGVKEGASLTRRSRKQTPTDSPTEPTLNSNRVTAKPLVRKLAKDKGIDLSTLVGTGLNGEVTREDVQAALGGGVVPPSVSQDHAGERIPVRGVQRLMAEAMVASAFTAPHVTEWVEVDMSRTLEVVDKIKTRSNERITPFVLVSAALIRAAQKYPRINSSWIDTKEGADVLIHPNIHLGFATDTSKGLLVPVVRNANADNPIALSASITTQMNKARDGSASPSDLTGGTITVTNVGVFGVDGGTPIITPGQAAILAMGRIMHKPWVVDDSIVIRPIMQLTFSFDHRIIDGALGSRALASVASYLADPALDELLLKD
ncbi:MAG: dihydrolipoamide acetyltransferase family protein [Candidatus Nanopelagicales bacterium]|nr:dihydrolipoamide acetyltransferase family protein [Candidatus Nanopelagicales bacterium]